MARPRSSTSGGQFAGRVPVSAVAATVAEATVPAAAAFLVLDVPGGFQFRKAVQILQGFPSGPMIIPGGTDSLFEASGAGEFGSPIVVICAEQFASPDALRQVVIESGRGRDVITAQLKVASGPSLVPKA